AKRLSKCFAVEQDVGTRRGYEPKRRRRDDECSRQLPDHRCPLTSDSRRKFPSGKICRKSHCCRVKSFDTNFSTMCFASPRKSCVTIEAIGSNCRNGGPSRSAALGRS